MIVEHSGWDKGKGSFNCRYYVPNKDMIIIEYGKEYKQLKAFEMVEKDWNNDGEIYTMSVALFESEYGTDYYTAEDLVSLVVEDGIEIKGINKIS